MQPDGLSELFFSRVMFPIRDRRGRTISFGGRILGDGQPKYVNGPETALFSKRRNLYALDLAREGVRGGATLVVVEGYMDVIALHQAGFTAAVAPLGTALTEEQLEALWRLSPAPVLCFDGDAAGARAGARASELALPHAGAGAHAEDRHAAVGRGSGHTGPPPGRAGLPGGASMPPRPLADALYGLLHENVGATTPEQRAAFRTKLEEAARRIPDRALASEYRRVLLDRFYAGPRGVRSAAGRRRCHPAPRRARSPTATSRMASACASSRPSCCVTPACCTIWSMPTPRLIFRRNGRDCATN